MKKLFSVSVFIAVLAISLPVYAGDLGIVHFQNLAPSIGEVTLKVESGDFVRENTKTMAMAAHQIFSQDYPGKTVPNESMWTFRFSWEKLPYKQECVVRFQMVDKTFHLVQQGKRCTVTYTNIRPGVMEMSVK